VHPIVGCLIVVFYIATFDSYYNNRFLDIIWIITISAFIILAIACAFLITKLAKSKKERTNLQVQMDHLQKQLDTIELKSVESKLNPHLFKNILNSIQSHAYQTYFTLDKLGNVLDYILYDSRSKFVTPKEEIEFALNLIEINKIKLSPLFEFRVKQQVDEQEALYTQKLLAPLISIDLIENAFKHADLQNADSFIKINFELKNGIFGITVANKISPKTPLHKERGGIGSETLENRLKIIYKTSYHLERITEGDTYIAHLKINLREYKAQMHSA
jgi:sensor histidine kinase YesM